MVKIKICGITNLEDALASVDAGYDALGFVFYKKSPRYIAPIKARGIIKKLPGRIIKIGIFANAKEKDIRRIAKLCKLDMLQFHGHESPEFCQRFKAYKIIKAFRIKNNMGLKNILRYKTFAYLFDTFIKSKIGGTGRNFNWKLITDIRTDIKCPIFLSGGINAKNVKKAITSMHPEWIDVSSSLEKRPGRKDHRKIRDFFEEVRKYD